MTIFEQNLGFFYVYLFFEHTVGVAKFALLVWRQKFIHENVVSDIWKYVKSIEGLP